MSISPSSSAQAAREGVARQLRELRQDAGLTVTQLAAKCGWHHAKTSRIENAKTPPSIRDIRDWCATCQAPASADDLIAASRHAETLYTEWRRRVRTGLRQLQDSYVQLYRSTGVFRVYSPTLVPGLVQTEGYANAVLSTNARLLDIPDDGAEAAAARIERSQVIREPGHRCLLLVEESVLYFQLDTAESAAAQLGHLLSVGALPAVSLGIIPMATRERALWPQETFHVYDDTLVSVELLSAQVNITQPSEIELYLKAFEQLRSMAVYGADARALIVRAIDALG
ncbi:MULTISPECIES: helix-turn-helix transcriptional regulator [unclassified Streptomyces]|uniref:helix-turn-helix domain-containing protein n=1 Tax=unclassified Streptomyces TaxID=2593676 RepID=UPI0029AEBD29|nr:MULTISPECIES: helix-turn-helix transcriptional regulator [unclassified Streptomyces]MDX3771246.1 helix-turn-helix transcriptional regulator [Streptomyces sp. AK08-01B]MDX3820715.1 helix-turn-helix transcriptional regulator [Streptomyces sp. AK08-01A]